jgi:hypothetical protein
VTPARSVTPLLSTTANQPELSKLQAFMERAGWTVVKVYKGPRR